MLPASSFKVVRLGQVRFEFETPVVDHPTKTEGGFRKLRTAIKLLLVVETTNFFKCCWLWKQPISLSAVGCGNNQFL